MTSNPATPSAYPTINPSEAPSASQDWETIRTSLIIYLPSFVVIILLFCYVRLKFPIVYNVRNTIESLHNPLSASSHGFFSWIWKIYLIDDDDIFATCGMDALCMLRITRMGSHLSLICVVCSIFLIPVYNHEASTTTGSEYSDDAFVARTATNLPENSDSFTATVVGAYIIFGSSMYLIMKEFRWFIPQREKFLSLTEARSYTVYVSGIPRQHRSNDALVRYFRRVIAEDAVHSASVLMHLPKLAAAVNLQTKLIRNLERAQAIQEMGGKQPMHTILRPGSKDVMQRVPAIPYIKHQLDNVREEIQELASPVRFQRGLTTLRDNGSTDNVSIPNFQEDNENCQEDKCDALSVSLIASGAYIGPSVELDLTSEKALIPTGNDASDTEFIMSEHDRSIRTSSLLPMQTTEKLVDNTSFRTPTLTATDTIVESSEVLFHSDCGAANISTISSNKATKPTSSKEGNSEGVLLDTAFVTFKKLSAVAVALQSVHSTAPFQMNVFEAPSPDQVLWNNVGLSNKVLQPRRLLTFILTSLLCLFWTVPVSFLATLTEVEILKEKLPFLENWLEAAPWLEHFLNQISPLLISFLNSVVAPVILRLLSTLEGVIGLSHQEASLYTKMATFYLSYSEPLCLYDSDTKLIQTFLVASMAGRITAALVTVDSVGDVLRYLAKTLPPQSIFYMQLVLIQTVIGLGCELLRTTALIQAFFRSFVGPSITKTDRSEPYLGLRPLCSPRYFLYAHSLSGASLRFMVLFTFAVLSPFVSYVLLFSFLAMELCSRHHLIYVYPPSLDSGGLLWLQFTTITIICMLIAESILMSYMALSKATYQMYLMCPLFVSTTIFFAFLRQRHYTVAKFLSLETCDDIDATNFFHQCEDWELDFLTEKYLQPEIRATTAVKSDGI